jgi:hypothetical protein
MTSHPPPVLCEACESGYIAGQACPGCGTETCSQCGWCDECAAQTITAAELALRAYGPEHDARCIYCEHGPYCPACPPPDSIPGDAHVCASCRETITRGEIAADPYYSGNWP